MPLPAGTAIDPSSNPHAEVATRELEQALNQLGWELGEPYRDVLRLHLEEGLNAKEIAARLARPAGTVRTQLMRALDLVRQRLPKGFDAGRGAVAVVHGPALAAARTAVLEAAGAAAPAVMSSVVATTSLGAKLIASKALVGFAAVVFATVAGWGTVSFAAGRGGNPALVGMAEPFTADTVLAEELEPSGDSDLDELRRWAVKAPIEELESHIAVFVDCVRDPYASDGLLWHGMERLVDRVMKRQHFGWPRLCKRVLVQVIEFADTRVLPPNGVRLQRRVPEVKRVPEVRR